MTIPQLLIGFHYTKHECKQIIGDVCSSLKKGFLCVLHFLNSKYTRFAFVIHYLLSWRLYRYLGHDVFVYVCVLMEQVK